MVRELFYPSFIEPVIPITEDRLLIDWEIPLAIPVQFKTGRQYPEIIEPIIPINLVRDNRDWDIPLSVPGPLKSRGKNALNTTNIRGVWDFDILVTPPTVAEAGAWKIPLILPIPSKSRFKNALNTIDEQALWDSTILPIAPANYTFNSYNVRSPSDYLFGAHPQSGDIVGPYAYDGSANTLHAKETVFYQPFPVPYPIHIVALGVSIATAHVTATAELGIYGSYRGSIETLIVNDIVSLNTIGLRELPVNVFLSAGLYWFAIVIKGDDVQMHNSVHNYLVILPKRQPDLVLAPEYYVQIATASLPDTPSEYVPDNIDAPYMYARIGT